MERTLLRLEGEVDVSGKLTRGEMLVVVVGFLGEMGPRKLF